MIIWGGVGAAPLADGGRYDPVSDSWAPVTSAGAPTARAYHTAVGTGVEMLVWGGSNAGFVNYSDGGRYSIITHAWTAMSNIGAPSLRHSHTATWTGSEMLIWGGVGTVSLNDGKRYKPSNDT